MRVESSKSGMARNTIFHTRKFGTYAHTVPKPVAIMMNVKK